MEKEVCICSVLSLRKGESAQETALSLTTALWEQYGKGTVVYVPAGIQFTGPGTVSMTELYFSYRKKQEMSVHFEQRKPIFVKPFHCFLESEEIENEQYYGFLTALAELAECMVVPLDGLSPGRLHWFLKHSNTIVVLTDCEKGNPSPQHLGFLKNLQLLWGENFKEEMRRFLFVAEEEQEGHKGVFGKKGKKVGGI